MRSRRAVWPFTIGAVLILLGAGYAVLPEDWIEATLHVEPDGGNGLLEVLLPVLLAAAGAGLTLRSLLARRAARAATAGEGLGSRATSAGE
jgi:hypothetical protein